MLNGGNPCLWENNDFDIHQGKAPIERPNDLAQRQAKGARIFAPQKSQRF